jgi:hypothetical protein
MLRLFLNQALGLRALWLSALSGWSAGECESSS